MTEKIYSIKEIEALTEAQAASLAEEKEHIKDHVVYFVNFAGAFGYSALVFADIRHIYYANEYELHYPGRLKDEPEFERERYSKEELKSIYIQKLEQKLFTDDEICAPVRDYDEYTRKAYYVRNYYSQRRDSVSIFGIFVGEEGRKKERELERCRATMSFNPVALAYYQDKAFVERNIALMDSLNRARAQKKDDFEYWKGAFEYEMYNHEYTYSEDDYSVLSVFGSLTSDNRKDYFKQLGFSDIQKNAYLAARKKVLRCAC